MAYAIVSYWDAEVKKGLNIAAKVGAGVLLVLYVAVAAMNYSLVQTYVGHLSGSYFSRQWGGEVSVGSLGLRPLSGFVAHDLLLVSPEGDTILRAEALRLHFKQFPFKKGGAEGEYVIGTQLRFGRVALENVYFHLEKYSKEDSLGRSGINLQYIIDYFNRDRERKSSGKKFVLEMGTLTLKHMHFRLDLPSKRAEMAGRVNTAHMEFADISGKFKDFKLVNDDVSMRIVRMATEERSGFRVEEMSGRMRVARTGIELEGFEVLTPQSHLCADGYMHYGHWRELGDIYHSVECRLALGEGTRLAMRDVAYWMRRLPEWDLQLEVSGEGSGRIDSLQLDGLRVGYGGGTQIEADGLLVGLPSIKGLSWDIDQLRVRSREADVGALMASVGGRLPSGLATWLRQAGRMELTASGRGTWEGTAWTDARVASQLGSLHARGSWRLADGRRQLLLEAQSGGLNFGSLKSDWLTQSGLTLKAEASMPKGKVRPAQVKGRAEVELHESVVKGQRLAPIGVTAGLDGGTVEVAARCADSLARFTLEGKAKLADTVRGYYASLDVQRLRADAFGLLKERFGEVKGQLVANFKGNTPDEMSGALVVQGAQMGEARIEEATLTVRSDGRRKEVRLESEAVEASASGNFAYADLPLMARRTAEKIVPAALHGERADGEGTDYAAIESSTVAFNVQWLDGGRLLQALAPTVAVAAGTRLSGSYNHYELLKVAMRSERLRVGSVEMKAVGATGQMEGDAYRLAVESPSVAVGQREWLQNVEATLLNGGEHAEAGLAWGNGEAESEGDLRLALDSHRVSVVHPGFRVGRHRWEVGIDSLLVYRRPRLSLCGSGIRLTGGEQGINATVQLLGGEEDYVELDFERFNLASVGSVLLKRSQVEVAGRVDGRFSMFGFGRVPYFNASLAVDSCVVNSQQLGDMGIHSDWNAEQGALNLQVEGKRLNAQGWMGLGQEEKPLHFTVGFDKFELAMAAPFLKAFASNFGGQLHGSFDIGGTLKSPVIKGEAKVEEGVIRVEATGVSYQFADSLHFRDNYITLQGFRVADHQGHVALLDGTIRYGGTDLVELDLGVQADSLLLLDRPRGNNYRGRLLAGLRGGVKGNMGNMRLTGAATTLQGSTLAVPISSQRQVKSQSFITFVEDHPLPAAEEEKPRSGSKVPFNIELDITLTPDLELQLPIDFSEVGANISGSGYGALHVSMVPGETPRVVGNYEVTSGGLKLSMLSLFTKNFTIESGSSIAFPGGISDARFDIKAVHSQRVNLSTLTGSLSSLDNTQKYLQVENIIAIAGTLREPTVGFDLRLPGADASVEEEVFAYIDRSSERDMINQTMSLLLRGQFYNTSQADNSGSGNNSLAGGYSVLASSVSSIVSDMVQFVNVDVNYQAGDDLTHDQLDVNISKDWGKWYIESTVGYGGESREIEASTANGTIIDALIGYRLNPLVHLFVYNRTNTNDYTRTEMPYKQGAGVKLTKDFDRWGDLFGRRSKKGSGK